MTFTPEALDELLTMLWARMPTGRDFAICSADLARELDISEPLLHVLAAELRARDYPVVTAFYLAETARAEVST